jgi:hypothetical protein
VKAKTLIITSIILAACTYAQADSRQISDIDFDVRSQVVADNLGVFNGCTLIIEGMKDLTSTANGFSLGLGITAFKTGRYSVELYHRIKNTRDQNWQPNKNHSMIQWVKIGDSAPLSLSAPNLITNRERGYSAWTAEDINVIETLSKIENNIPIWINVHEEYKDKNTYSGLLRVDTNQRLQFIQCIKEIDQSNL